MIGAGLLEARHVRSAHRELARRSLGARIGRRGLRRAACDGHGAGTGTGATGATTTSDIDAERLQPLDDLVT
jgi:hypothetical protein